MSINIDLGKKYFLQKLYRMKGSIFNLSYIFALKPLFFEKNEIKKKKLPKSIKGAVPNW